MDHTPVSMDHWLIFPDEVSDSKSRSSETDRLQWPLTSKSSLGKRTSEIWSLPPRLKTVTINEVNPFRNQHSSSSSPRLSDPTERPQPFWSSNKCQHHFTSPSSTTKFAFPLGHIKSSWVFCLRTFQITTLVLSFLLLSLLVNSIKGTIRKEQESTLTDPLNFRTWITSPLEDDEVQENSNKLLDLEDFHFILNNASKCSVNKEDDKIFFIILVHSAPKNFEERQAIRTTWGSVQVQIFDNFYIRLVFLLGTSADVSLESESQEFGDIISGNFIDSYRNLTYKHLMGYQFVLQYCSSAKYVLKTDDDAFVDIFQLINFIRRTFGENPRKSLICNVLPEGTHPVRNGDNDTETKSKWSVTKEEYSYNIYPKYCSGLAYLATTDVLRDLLRISGSVKYMWIDDVFVTGIIRDLAAVEPFYLNLRYSYEAQDYRKWLTRGGHDVDDLGKSRNISSSNRLPFMFAHLERGRYLGYEMRNLWQKASRLIL